MREDSGIETEFRSTHPIEAVNDAPCSAFCALFCVFPSGSDEAKRLEEITDALQTGEIVELLINRTEAAPG